MTVIGVQAKHMAGPWKLEYRDPCGAMPAGWLIIDPTSDNGDVIAQVNPDDILTDLGHDNKATAKLIAAAPELLDFAALIARMKTEEEFGENTPASEDWIATLNELIVTARPLVAKAEGR